MKAKYDPSQMELFLKFKEDDSDNKKKRFFSKVKPQVKMPPRHIFNIPYENMIVVVAGVFFLVVLSFCLGVKRGEIIFRAELSPGAKDGYGSNPRQGNSGDLTSVSQSKPVMPAISREDLGANSLPVKVKHGEAGLLQAQEAEPEPEIEVLSRGKKYTIQLITYSQQAQAAKEVNKLKASGADAFYIMSGRFYKVCSGAYADTSGARKDIADFKRNRWYKDCFLRKYSQ